MLTAASYNQNNVPLAWPVNPGRACMRLLPSVLQLEVLTEVFLSVVVVRALFSGPPVGAFSPVYRVTCRQPETSPYPHFTAVG